MDRLSIEFLSRHLWLVIVFCLALLAASYFYYRRTTPPLPKMLRGLLFVFRGAAFLALFLALAQPIISYNSVTQAKKKMAVLLDNSTSMNQPLRPESDRTRLQEAEDVLNGPELARLRDNLDITTFAYAESLVVADQSQSLPGKMTDPGQALTQLRRQSAIDPYDYIMMVSDGRVTEGEDPGDVAAEYGRPVLAIAVGDSVRVEDIALDNVDYNEVVFAGKQTEIKAVVSQQGAFDGKLQIHLSDGNTVLTQRTDDPPGDGKTGEYTLTYTPSKPGRMFLNLEVTGPNDEANPKNNRRTFAVRVLKSKLNVLAYSSSVNQEYAFLNRFLKSRDDYEITRVIDAPGGDRLGERFPTTQERLNSFDLVILIDPNLNRLSSHYDEFISYMTDRGGAVLLLMGEEYDKSAPGNRLETLSPLAVSSARRSPVRYGKFHIVPNPQMTFHPVIKLAETREDIDAAWANQPPFSVSVPVDSVRSGSVTLGYLEGELGRGRDAAAAYKRYGAGKILAFSVAPFWNWAFLPIGVGSDVSIYNDFFAATIRWLTISDESDRLSFKPVKDVFQSGEEVVFEGFIRDEGFRPIEGAGGDLVVVSADGDSSLVSIIPDPAREGGYRANAGVLPPGSYTYHAQLAADSVKLGRLHGEFAVDDIDRETAFSAVDWNSLARAARNSGGVFASYNNLEPLLDAVDLDRVRVERTHEYRIWDNIVLLIIILVALSAEWFIRKRRQLL